MPLLFTLLKKELRAYLNSSTAYIVGISFLLLAELLFFRQAFLVGESSLVVLFAVLPWLYLLLLPALSMGTLSEESAQGTLEFVGTRPIREWQLVVSKFLAALNVVGLILLVTLPLGMSFAFFGNLDMGVLFSQYLAALFLAAWLLALGVALSSVCQNPISSLVLTAVASFVALVLGTEIVTAALPLSLSPFLNAVAPLNHYHSMARGVVDVRDVVYAVSSVGIFLSIAYLRLLKRRVGNVRIIYRAYQMGVGLMLGIAVLATILSAYIPLRADLTRDNVFTLSNSTKTISGNLTDVVNVTLYASSEIPAQFQTVLRETKDILRDYERLARGNIVLTTKDPLKSSATAQEAEGLGIRPVQFNVMGKGELSVKQGYMGLAVNFGDKREVIPFIQSTADLEYQLTTFVRKLTIKNKSSLGFIANAADPTLNQNYSSWKQELAAQFDVQDVTLDEKTATIPAGIRALVLANPSVPLSAKAKQAMSDYLGKGGALLVLANPVNVSVQTLQAKARDAALTDFLKDYGVTLNTNLVYDLRSNAPVRVGGGFITLMLPYPLWTRVLPVPGVTSPIINRIESLVLPWASSISLDEVKIKEKNLTLERLFTTSPYAGVQQGNFMLKPDGAFSQTNLTEHIMAVALSAQSKTRLVVMGNATFLTDGFAQEQPTNLAFGVNALSWLTNEESLADLKVKQLSEHKLLFQNDTQRVLVQWGNIAWVVLVPLLVGLFRMMRRRALAKKTYPAQ